MTKRKPKSGLKQEQRRSNSHKWVVPSVAIAFISVSVCWSWWLQPKELLVTPGDCMVLGADAGSWQAALSAGSPVIAPLSELVTFDGAPLDYWDLFPPDSIFDFSVSPDEGFYNVVADQSSYVGLRRKCPARIKGVSWSLVRDMMTYLVKRANYLQVPQTLEAARLPNEHDPLGDGPVPIRKALEKYHVYLSGESNKELYHPSSAKLRAIGNKIKTKTGREWEVTNAWVSAGGTMSNLHFDGGDNWLCQLAGTKTATMFPHEDLNFLYPVSFNKDGDMDYRYVLRPNGTLQEIPIQMDHRDDKIYAAVLEHAPDLQRFPDFAKARRKVCSIQPGQCLGIPHHYWHNIRSKEGEINFSLNFGFGSSPGFSPEMKKEMKVRMAEMKARQHLMRTRKMAK